MIRRGKWLAAAAVVAGAMVGLATAAGPASAASADQWRISNIGSSSQGALDSVVATGPANAWAVGTAYRGGTPTGPLVEHWNGRGWQTTSIPGSGGIFLDLVAASAPNNVWTAGNAFQATKIRIYHYDGAHWHSMPVPPDIEGLADLVAFGPKNVWLLAGNDEQVQCTHSGSGTCADVWHWNGSNWQDYAFQGPAGSGISSLSGTSDGNLWLVGLDNQKQQYGHTVGIVTAYRLGGTRWQPMTITHVGGQFPDVAVDPATGVYIGYQNAKGTAITVLHGDGHGYKGYTTPGGSNGAAGLPMTPDGHGGFWLGPWEYYNGKTLENTVDIPFPRSYGTWNVFDVEKIPGTAESFWGAGVGEPGSSTTGRPLMAVWGPTP
jgi:hypothetical protein